MLFNQRSISKCENWFWLHIIWKIKSQADYNLFVHNKQKHPIVKDKAPELIVCRIDYQNDQSTM